MSVSAAVHNALREAVAAGPFYAVSRDRNTREVSIGVEHIAPASLVLHEVGSQFGPAIRLRTTNARERRMWRWTVAIRFDREVSLEDFESRVSLSPPRVDRDTDAGLPQVLLKLVSVDPRHPVNQSPSSGTEATLHFEAELSPI